LPAIHKDIIMATGTTPPPWRRVFLRELGRSGSVARAAEAGGIDRSSAYQLRRRNAAFAASWDRALEGARETLREVSPSRSREGPGEGESSRTDTGFSSQTHTHPRPLPQAGGGSRQPTPRDHEIVRASKAGRPCIARVGPGRWSARSERAFLAELTATANVKAAARAAGVSAQAAYNRRRLWPAFAEAWRDALAEGYVRIETLLIHAATATLDPEPTPQAVSEAPAMTVEQAMNLFKLHRASQHGGKAQRYGWRRQEPDIEDVRAEILRKVAAMERAQARDKSY
jgi:hypothetical protein